MYEILYTSATLHKKKDQKNPNKKEGQFPL